MKHFLRSRYLFFLILSLKTNVIFAQLGQRPSPSYKEQVFIGQPIPDLTIRNVHNFNASTFHLYNFKGKLLILDFWATYCGSCIESLPLLDSLQREFNDKIQIVLVDVEPWEKIKSFFDKRKYILQMPQLPFVCSDTILLKYFPRNALPQDVWIDSLGILRYVTEAVNRKAINAFLNNKKIELHQVRYVPGFKPFHSLFDQGKGPWTKSIIYYSYISHFLEGANIGNMNWKINQGKSYRFSMYCRSVAEMYSIAFAEGDASGYEGKYDFHHSNTVILKVDNPYWYRRPENSMDFYPWADRYCYNYDLLIPMDRFKDLYSFIKQDLTRFFGLKGTIVRKKVKSWVLVWKNKPVILPDKPGKRGISAAPGDTLIHYNLPFSDFVTKIQAVFDNYSTPEPFFDETGYSGNLSICLRRKSLAALEHDNIVDLRKDLQKYGLNLVLKDKMADVLILQSKLN